MGSIVISDRNQKFLNTNNIDISRYLELADKAYTVGNNTYQMDSKAFNNIIGSANIRHTYGKQNFLDAFDKEFRSHLTSKLLPYQVHTQYKQQSPYAKTTRNVNKDFDEYIYSEDSTFDDFIGKKYQLPDYLDAQKKQLYSVNHQMEQTKSNLEQTNREIEDKQKDLQMQANLIEARNPVPTDQSQTRGAQLASLFQDNVNDDLDMYKNVGKAYIAGSSQAKALYENILDQSKDGMKFTQAAGGMYLPALLPTLAAPTIDLSVQRMSNGEYKGWTDWISDHGKLGTEEGFSLTHPALLFANSVKYYPGESIGQNVIRNTWDINNNLSTLYCKGKRWLEKAPKPKPLTEDPSTNYPTYDLSTDLNSFRSRGADISGVPVYDYMPPSLIYKWLYKNSHSKFKSALATPYAWYNVNTLPAAALGGDMIKMTKWQLDKLGLGQHQNTVLAHEYSHIHDYRHPSGAFRKPGEVPLSQMVDMSAVPKDIAKYFNHNLNTELKARGTQLKNYFNTDKLTGDMLKQAAHSYPLDNNMKQFFSIITDWDAFAEWLNQYAK